VHLRGGDRDVGCGVVGRIREICRTGLIGTLATGPIPSRNRFNVALSGLSSGSPANVAA
jgi:hypothetical protein